MILGGAAVLAIGVGALVASHLWNHTPPHARAVPVAASSPPAEPAPPSLTPSPIANDPANEPARSEPASSSPRSGARSTTGAASDSLAEEVRLLSRAERQLNDGLGEDALATLGEHERRFPRGALAEERMAARVEALCALGRIAEARTSLGRLARAFPKSGHLDSARRFCGSQLDATP
jgi:hypothetical protein